MTQISRLSGIPRDYYNHPGNNHIGSFGSFLSNVGSGVKTFASSDAGKQLIQTGATTLVNKLTAGRPTSSITLTSGSAPGSQTGNPSGNTGLIIAACAIGAILLLKNSKK